MIGGNDAPGLGIGQLDSMAFIMVGTRYEDVKIELMERSVEDIDKILVFSKVIPCYTQQATSPMP